MQPLRRSDREEYWNCLSHFFGFILSIAGTVWLFQHFRSRESSIFIAIMAFGICLVAVYACSTLSHFVRSSSQLSLFRKLDQASIYLLIVASYTPFSVSHQSSGWWFNFVLFLMWMMAITGFVSKLIFGHRVESVAIWVYLLLGWIPFISGMPFAGLVPLEAIGLIILGGMFYTCGTWFLYKDKAVWYNHAIWHIFVLLGSVTHFVAVCLYV